MMHIFIMCIYSSQNVIRMIKSRITWVGHVAPMEEMHKKF